MRDYNYIDDVEVLKDNILDEYCKIIYMKQKAEEVIDEQVEKYAPENMKEQAQGLVDDLKGKLGL